MKIQTLLTLTLLTALLIASYAPLQLATAQTDFNAYKGSAVDDIQIDGKIGTEWDDVAK